MRSRTLRLRVLETLHVVLCTLFLSSMITAQEAHIVTFDAPGADTNPGDNNGTYSSGINVWGAITGSYQDTNNAFHGFLRSPDGKFTTFEAPGADTSPYNGTLPTAINDLGAITGYYSDVNGFDHGFLRSPDGNFTTFDVPGVGGYGSAPIGINLEGTIVGYYTNPNYLFHSFIRYSNGTFLAFLDPGQCDTNVSVGCYGSELTNINLAGLSIGNYMDSDFVGHGLTRHPDGSFTRFEAPNSGTGQYQGTLCPGCSAGINVWGSVAGTYIDANSVQHGFLRSPNGTITTFDAPGAGTSSYQGTGCPSDCPTSLNDFGAITGIYIDSNWVYHGYLRSPNGDITTIDPAGSIFTWSSGVDDFGVIAGYYADASGVYHGFAAVPCDQQCSENDESATHVNPATSTNRLNPVLNRALNPKLRLMPWNRSVGVQPSKWIAEKE